MKRRPAPPPSPPPHETPVQPVYKLVCTVCNREAVQLVNSKCARCNPGELYQFMAEVVKALDNMPSAQNSSS
jgi:hypothetical protein